MSQPVGQISQQVNTLLAAVAGAERIFAVMNADPETDEGRTTLVRVLKDGWTTVTADGSLSAHYENTVLITDGEPEILTVAEGL